jgi:hypothetical protein
MAEALTRIPSSDLATKVLIDIQTSGYNIIFVYNDGSTTSENIEPYLEQLIQSMDSTVEAAVSSIVANSSIVNPDVGEEKNGDVRVSNSVASIYVSGTWVQVWPIV